MGKLIAAALASGLFAAPAVADAAGANLALGVFNLQFESRGMAVLSSGNMLLEGGFIHAYFRNARTAAGPFAGYEGVGDGGGGLTNTFQIGLEAQFFVNALTVYLQAAYLNVRDGMISASGWFARGSLRAFPKDNVRLEAGARFLAYQSVAIWTVMLEGEYQFPGRAISTMATLRSTIDPGGGQVFFTTLFGVRLHFGRGTLADQTAPMNVWPLVL